ncbi:kinesin-like protein KIN-12A [Phalaenopsis equestris]|uniref:kinesin-like protein KIN-12A n=1 Tax=Phalaenopsis equestris TaxID=78828 RepID=UPI0009E1F789|nr:kinesin-like protein KIN-12A [Phalaenopsis equestris]
MKALLHTRSGRGTPSETLTPPSHKQRPPKVPKENVEPNMMPPESSLFRSPPVSGKSPSMRIRCPLPPRPPLPSVPRKRKLSLETLPENGSAAPCPCDSGVRVLLRMRPLSKVEEEEKESQIVQKISLNSISILDHTFTFDSVADASSTQQDIFELVGVPLVENCLAGFNSSIFAYGQTGSGKTYTMWGLPSALTADCLLSQERGLTPRVFELLFSRINEEQAKHSDKQLIYQCHCSFLEIFNEQITDLLDPRQRNLQIREDIRTGVYVDCLTEEYVCEMKDVIQLLLKGLSNRRIGATSINVESSRSHCVFTCVVKCRSKSMSDGLSSLKTSRINLVDLAGSERQKATRAAGERLKEAGNINRSLSQLGNLINILAEVSQSGKHRHVPYRDSRLTFLLQESLGGNAKLAMICAISPSKRCKNETFSTLRFAQRAKAIKNQAVVNETMEDDVSVLREQIRQLKDELLRIKSNDTSTENNSRNSTGWNVQRSLNLLRLSLCRPRTLPLVDDDSDEEMEIVREGVEITCIEAHSTSDLEKFCANEEPNSLKDPKDLKPDNSDKEPNLNDTYPTQIQGSDFLNDQNKEIMSVEGYEGQQTVAEDFLIKSQEITEITDAEVSIIPDIKEDTFQDVCESVTILAKRKSLDVSCSEIIEEHSVVIGSDPVGANVIDNSHNSFTSQSHVSPCRLDITACETSLALESPISSKSPRFENCSRSLRSSTLISALPMSNLSPRLENCSLKSLSTSLTSASQKNISSRLEHDSGAVTVSFADNLNHNNAVHPTLSSRNSLSTAEQLAASLQHGLQVIDCHHRTSSARNPAFRFSLKPFDPRLLTSTNKVDIGIQTFSQGSCMLEDSSAFICSYCKNNALPLECDNSTEQAGLQIVPVEDGQSASKLQSLNRCRKLVPKAVEKVLAGAIRREMALEDHCAKQAAEIMHLNRLVQQYKHERECISVIEQTREDKICRLEGLMDGVIPTEEFMEEEFLSLRNEHMMLKEKFQNHPEVLHLKIELKRVQNELDGYRNFFNMGERDVLIEEIQDLKRQLQCFIDYSLASTCGRSPLLQLTHSTEHMSAPLTMIPETKEESAEQIMEQERRCWTEKESKWISLSEELRAELKSSRALTDKCKSELESEKKCSEELKEALQTALEVHTRTLEQYAELEERHIALLGRHRKMREGITDMKNAAARAGVKGADNKLIESLAAQIEALRAEREKERRYWRNENKGLQTQLRDTAEALEAAGELLVRLKEAEEAVTTTQEQVLAAEQRTEKAYQEIADLKKNYETEIATLNQLLESRSLKEGPFDNSSAETGLYSWFYNYDRCNI